MTDYADIEYPYQYNAPIQYDYMTEYEYVLREINSVIFSKKILHTK